MSRIVLANYVNVAGISGTDVPHVVVEKLQSAIDRTHESLASHGVKLAFSIKTDGEWWYTHGEELVPGLYLCSRNFHAVMADVARAWAALHKYAPQQVPPPPTGTVSEKEGTDLQEGSGRAAGSSLMSGCTGLGSKVDSDTSRMTAGKDRPSPPSAGAGKTRPVPGCTYPDCTCPPEDRCVHVAAMQAIKTYVPSSEELKAVCYCLINSRGLMYWDEECCVWSNAGDAEYALQAQQESEPDEGWRISALYSSLRSARKEKT